MHHGCIPKEKTVCMDRTPREGKVRGLGSLKKGLVLKII
jgi:hypothetical protein